MTARSADVVIVGAGQGGAQVALSLRKAGFKGTVRMVGDECQLPYNRPVLSKEFLLGAPTEADLLLRDAAYWAEAGIEVRLGVAAVAVEPDMRSVTLADGDVLRYTSLVLATGGSARPLPVSGHDLANVVSLRSWSDANTLRAAAERAQRVVVIGGGYLGLEVTAAFTQLGLQVTVVEATASLLNRTASPVVSQYFQDLHESSGVHVVLGAAVTRILGPAGRATGVQLTNGDVLAADLVVVAIGMRANDELLRVAGAACDDGALVDARCRTSLPDVYAVGDCARRVSEYGLPDQYVRLECVQTSVAHAKLAADDIAGLPYRPPGAPYFWSHQFTARYKSVGLSAGYDDLVIRRTDQTDAFTVSYLRDGTVVAIDCLNTLAGYARLRKDLEERVTSTAAMP